MDIILYLINIIQQQSKQITFLLNFICKYSVALWVAYYNFLRPHKFKKYKPLNELDELKGAENMPAKWQMLILLGQDAILRMQNKPICS